MYLALKEQGDSREKPRVGSEIEPNSTFLCRPTTSSDFRSRVGLELIEEGRKLGNKFTNSTTPPSGLQHSRLKEAQTVRKLTSINVLNTSCNGGIYS